MKKAINVLSGKFIRQNCDRLKVTENEKEIKYGENKCKRYGYSIFNQLSIISRSSSMIKINYPDFNFRLKKQDGKEFIFDEIRKRRVRLTPEEWVRQNFIQYLIQIKKYPASLLSVEKEIKLNDLKKRCDMVVFKNAAPWMIIECKAGDVHLTEQTVQQILAYNITLKSKFLVITNGINTFCLNTFTQKFLNELPEY